jgi:hypothetical protein
MNTRLFFNHRLKDVCNVCYVMPVNINDVIVDPWERELSNFM